MPDGVPDGASDAPLASDGELLLVPECADILMVQSMVPDGLHSPGGVPLPARNGA
jgi:hypothetical protein